MLQYNPLPRKASQTSESRAIPTPFRFFSGLCHMPESQPLTMDYDGMPRYPELSPGGALRAMDYIGTVAFAVSGCITGAVAGPPSGCSRLQWTASIISKATIAWHIFDRNIYIFSKKKWGFHCVFRDGHAGLRTRRDNHVNRRRHRP
jgi:hypothetical protein